MVGSSSMMVSEPPESASVSLATRSTVRGLPSVTSTVSALATGGRFWTVTVTVTVVASPPGSTIVAVKLDRADGRPDRWCDHHAVGLAGRPSRVASLSVVIDSASASVARSVTGITIDSPRNTSTALGTPTGSWLTSIVISPGRAEPARVDHRVADDHVAVLTVRRRVEAVREAGRADHVDERPVRAERTAGRPRSAGGSRSAGIRRWRPATTQRTVAR